MQDPGRGQRDEQLSRELQNHLDLEAEERRNAGASPADARYAAMRALGNRARIHEDTRSVWGWTAVETLIQDLRFSFRLLAKSPGFAAVAILTLALGIGANTAIFTVVNALLIQPLPFRDASRLVGLTTVFERYNTDRGSVAYADILDWKAQNDLFSAVAAWNRQDFDITSGDRPERIHGIIVDREYFHVMTDRPLIGRTFDPAADAQAGNRVVVLSEGLWKRRFGGDPKVVGETVDLSGQPQKIIGVMPARSLFPDDAEIVKLSFEGKPSGDVLRRDNHVFRAIGRLRAGVSLEQAQAKLAAMGERIAQEYPNRAHTGWKAHSLRGLIVGPELNRMLWIMLGAVFLVLLIACVNVANLLLARGAVREREVAIRSAFGAGRLRLARQFLVESMVLAGAGGLLGLVLGYAGSLALIRYAPEGVPPLDGVGIDFTVLAFAVGLCLMTAILFGLAPVFHATRTGPADSIREGGRAGSDGVRAKTLRHVLVVSELALAVVLLAASGLLIRSLTLLQRVDPGFNSNKLLTMSVALPNSRYGNDARISQTFQQMLDSIRQLPGVVAASGTSSLPLNGGGFYLGRVFLTTGQPEPPASSDTEAQWSVIQPDYLKTIGVPLAAGRSFSEYDTATSKPVILISQSMARQMFPGQNPVGRSIRSWRDENLYREIVGVVADLHYRGVSDPLVNNVYVPHTQNSWPFQVLVIRTGGEPHAVLRSIENAIWVQDSKLAISEVRTMNDIADEGLARPRFAAFLLGVFAATALAMAAIGIYGLMSYVVARRTREIGIRMALGALRWDILRGVAGHALLLACIGVAIGVTGALAVTRLMQALLFGVSPTDAVTFLAASALLILIAVAAACIPARRASRIDPLAALRYE